MMRTIFVGAALFLAAAACSHEPQQQTTAPPPGVDTAAPIAEVGAQDKDFVNDAAEGGMLEVALGKIAATRAITPSVKNFASMMQVDHGQADAKLQMMAKREGIEPPQALDPDHQKMVDDLAKLQGCEFETQYVKMMLKDHEADVAKFEQEEKAASDPAVREFAASTLPTLREHLSLIRSIDDDESNGKTSCGYGGNYMNSQAPWNSGELPTTVPSTTAPSAPGPVQAPRPSDRSRGVPPPP